MAIIRSTSGHFEPRYKSAIEILQQQGFRVHEISWVRSMSEQSEYRGRGSDTFVYLADYGRGLRNLLGHLKFSHHTVKRLRALKPQYAYVCDLDAFFPTLIAFGLSGYEKIIYDQFDPIASRLKKAKFFRIINFIEALIVTKAKVKISANRDRIPSLFRDRWLELPNIFPISRPQVRVGHTNRQPSYKLLFYGGILHTDRGLDYSAQLIETLDSWRLEICGGGPELESLKRLNLSKTILYGQISHDKLLEYAAAADLILALYDPKYSHNRYTASNKLYEACQLEIPVIASEGTKIGESVKKWNLGWVVPFGSKEHLRIALDEFANLQEFSVVGIRSNLRRFFQKELAIKEEALNALRNAIGSEQH